MKGSIILASLYGIINGVVIDPTSPDPDGYAIVTLSADPRGKNGIDTDNTYKLYQQWSDPLNELLCNLCCISILYIIFETTRKETPRIMNILCFSVVLHKIKWLITNNFFNKPKYIKK